MENLKLHIPKIQQQDNSVNCGVFAIAYATSILNGENPEKLVFDSEKLRQHLISCFCSGTIKPFPSQLKR